MIRTSAPFASWILQRQLTEMKEAAVTPCAMLANWPIWFNGQDFRFHHAPKKRTSRAQRWGISPHISRTAALFVVLVGCMKLLTTAAGGKR